MRSRLSGVNKVAIPMGVARTISDGRTYVTTADGRYYGLRANGTISSIIKGATRGTLNPGGRVTSLSTPTLRISSGVQGRSVITARRPDHITLVSTGRRSGYLERKVGTGSHPDLERIYVSGGRTYRRRYVKRSYMGIPVTEFMPQASYSSAFGTWTSLAWPTPVNYPWSWAQDRWYGRHRAYFSVWPSYRGVNYWLTDYLLGALILESDDPQQPADGTDTPDAGSSGIAAEQSTDISTENENTGAAVATPISPEVKEALASEVQQEIALTSKGEAVAGEDGTLRPSELSQVIVPGRVFVVGVPTFVDWAPEDGATTIRASAIGGATDCSLSPGDLVRLDRLPVPRALPAVAGITSLGPITSGQGVEVSYQLTGAVVEIVAGQKGDCAAGTRVNVSLSQLEEMENELRAGIDDGLRAFSTEQGKKGLPAAPVGSLTIAAEPATGGQSVVTMLQELRGEATDAEKELTRMTASSAEIAHLQ